MDKHGQVACWLGPQPGTPAAVLHDIVEDEGGQALGFLSPRDLCPLLTLQACLSSDSWHILQRCP